LEGMRRLLLCWLGLMGSEGIRLCGESQQNAAAYLGVWG